MKFEIELTELEAACIWADATWSGKNPRTLQEILTDRAKDMADHYLTSFPGSGPQAVEDLRRTLAQGSH